MYAHFPSITLKVDDIVLNIIFYSFLIDGSEFYPDCTDKVRHWQRLGFVVQVPLNDQTALPVTIETERDSQLA